MLTITETGAMDMKKLSCPHCHDVLPRVRLSRESRIQGLTFRCRKCGRYWAVTSEVTTE